MCVCVSVYLSVCLSVCLSVKSHLTSGASFRPENAVTHSADDKGQNTCGVFSETPQLSRSSSPSLGWPYIRSAIFAADNTHAICRDTITCQAIHAPRVLHFSAFI